MEKENVVSREVAISEIQNFVEKYDDKKLKDFEVESQYSNLLSGVERGFVVFGEDGVPMQSLKTPIKNTEGEISTSEINYKTRIKPQTLCDIMKGLDIGKNQPEYILRCQAYLSGKAKAEIDKLSKFDYKILEEICTVFM